MNIVTVGLAVQYFAPEDIPAGVEKAKAATITKINTAINVDLDVHNGDGTISHKPNVAWADPPQPGRWRWPSNS